MYSGLTPQQKAARVSAENRARDAAERRAYLARPVQYAAEHERGEHEGINVARCPLCPIPAQEEI